MDNLLLELHLIFGYLELDGVFRLKLIKDLIKLSMNTELRN